MSRCRNWEGFLDDLGSPEHRICAHLLLASLLFAYTSQLGALYSLGHIYEVRMNQATSQDSPGFRLFKIIHQHAPSQQLLTKRQPSLPLRTAASPADGMGHGTVTLQFQVRHGHNKVGHRICMYWDILRISWTHKATAQDPGEMGAVESWTSHSSTFTNF